MNPFIHPSAKVSEAASIGADTRVWHEAQIREGARVGRECVVGKGAYIDFDVVIGDRCKLQNGVYVYHGVTIDDGVFLGPGVMLLNDKTPRAVNPDGSPKSDSDWTVFSLHVGYGAAIGGGAMVSPGVTLGKWASVGAGAVVTRNVPAYGLVYGNPARLVGYVCACGHRLKADTQVTHVLESICSRCGADVPEELRPGTDDRAAQEKAAAESPSGALADPAAREFTASGNRLLGRAPPPNPARREVIERGSPTNAPR